MSHIAHIACIFLKGQIVQQLEFFPHKPFNRSTAPLCRRHLKSSSFLIILRNEFSEPGEGVVGLHPGGRAPGAGVQLERGVGGPERGSLVDVRNLGIKNHWFLPAGAMN